MCGNAWQVKHSVTFVSPVSVAKQWFANCRYFVFSSEVIYSNKLYSSPNVQQCQVQQWVLSSSGCPTGLPNDRIQTSAPTAWRASTQYSQHREYGAQRKPILTARRTWCTYNAESQYPQLGATEGKQCASTARKAPMVGSQLLKVHSITAQLTSSPGAVRAWAGQHQGPLQSDQTELPRGSKVKPTNCNQLP